MQITGLWAYVLLETLLIAGAYLVYLRWKQRRLQRRVADLEAVPAAEPEPPADPAPADTSYTDHLQQQIAETKARLAQLAEQAQTAPPEPAVSEAESPEVDLQEMDPQEGESQVAGTEAAESETQPHDAEDEAPLQVVAATRLAFLQAEREATEKCGTDSECLWKAMTAALQPFLPTAEEAEPAPPVEDQSRLVEALQTRLQAYEQRVANLEQFRTNFFDLKAKYADALKLGQQLHEQVGIAMVAEDQPPELRDAMEKLKEENANLERQLAQVDQEFDNMMRNLSAATDRTDLPPAKPGIASSMDTIGQGVEKMKDVANSQEERIQALTDMIADLKLELTEKQKLERALDEQKDKHRELTNVISVIQDENLFLQEQISVLLKQELENQNDVSTRMKELEVQVEQQREAYEKLELQLASTEKEYLAVYEENKRLKG